MTDKQVHELIEAQRPERKQALYEALRAELNFPDVREEVKPRRKFNYKIFSVAMALAVVLCLAVVLPLVLLNTEEEIRYNSDDLLWASSDLTVKEYALQNNLPLLYVDWYDGADECVTVKYYEKTDDEKIVYFTEQITNGETGASVFCSVVFKGAVVEELDIEWDNSQSTAINGIDVAYFLNFSQSKAKFEYQGYKYYLTFSNIFDEQFVLDTIQSMFR